jgi:hypothetical protein
MNRIRTALLGLGLLFAVSGVQAQENGVKANIPFDFVVGNQVLPAGEYLVTPQGSTNQAIVIRSTDRKTAVMSLAFGCSLSAPSGQTKLVFHTLGGRYFLSQIWAQGYSQGHELRKSSAEIEMAKNQKATGEFVLAARSTR